MDGCGVIKMENMNITDAKYHLNGTTGQQCAINCVIDGQEMSVPLKEGNRHYDEIMRQVDEGILTIADADPLPEE